MTPTVIDTQQLKTALRELLRSDKEFMRELIRQTVVEMATEEMEKMDKESLRKALRDKYKQKGGIKLSVIDALQNLFDDAPSAIEMTQMLTK